VSRSGYSDDADGIGLWRANVRRTIASKRGQAFLHELRDALDAMPAKRLIQEELVTPDGECCTMGAVCRARGLSTESVDPSEPDDVADLLGVSSMMAREIAYENDERDWTWDPVTRTSHKETAEERWTRMRAWVEEQITPVPDPIATPGEQTP
jgi:hypothetical protein